MTANAVVVLSAEVRRYVKITGSGDGDSPRVVAFGSRGFETVNGLFGPYACGWDELKDPSIVFCRSPIFAPELSTAARHRDPN
jgi:hypothetical protein